MLARGGPSSHPNLLRVWGHLFQPHFYKEDGVASVTQTGLLALSTSGPGCGPGQVLTLSVAGAAIYLTMHSTANEVERLRSTGFAENK